MRTLEVTTKQHEREHHHGEIEEVNKDGVESNIKVFLELVINKDNLTEFHKEIQEIVRRYALWE